jgi:hypothetical protein
MFRFIAEIVVRSKVKKENSKRKKSFIVWQKVEKIAILLEEEDALNKSEIDALIVSTKKYVEVFYIELRSKQASYSDWRCFSRKNASLIGLPESEALEMMKNKSFNLVINACSERNLFAISLSSASKAQLHCASNNLYNEAEFIVKRLENQKLLNYLNNVIQYLKMIKN